MESYRNKRLRKRIEDRIHSARNRALLIDKLIDGLSYKEVSEKYNLSVRGCQYIVSKAKATLFK